MVHGVKYISNDMSYLKKPHFCPECNTKLKTVKVSKIINSKSPEAKLLNSSSGAFSKTRFIGNIKYVWKELECPNCQRHLTVGEMKRLEGYTENESGGNSIIGKIAFVICGILFVIFMALIKKYFN